MTDSLPTWNPEDPGPGGTLSVQSNVALDSSFMLTGEVKVEKNGQLTINQQPLDDNVTFTLKGDMAGLVISDDASGSEAKVINNDNLVLNDGNLSQHPSYVVINRNGTLENKSTLWNPSTLEDKHKSIIFLYNTKLKVARGGLLSNHGGIYSSQNSLLPSSDSEPFYEDQESIINNNGTFRNFQRFALTGEDTVLTNKGLFFNHKSKFD